MLSKTGLNFNTRTPGFQSFDITRNNYFCPSLERAQRICSEMGIKTINNKRYKGFTVSLNLENIDGTRQEKQINNKEKRISDEEKLNKLKNLRIERKIAAEFEKLGYTTNTTGICNEEQEIIQKMMQSIDNDEKKQGKVLEKRREWLANTIAEHGYKLYYDKEHKKLAAEKSLELLEEELSGLFNKEAVKKPIDDIELDKELPNSAILPHYKS
ncbi:MAG: hypothetical protein GX568_10505 [Candidatus Gastranaerophilales bacterium]|nr:hypothetical protein [Candidatus Gastranaerophilales bacterium]